MTSSFSTTGRQSGALPSRAAGLAALAAAAVAIGGAAWLAFGTVGALKTTWPVDYVLVIPPLRLWLLAAVLAFAGLLAFHALTTRSDSGLNRFAMERVRYVLPFWLLMLPLVSAGLLLTPLANLSTSWILLFLDLRFWLIAAAAMLVLHARLGSAASENMWRPDPAAAARRMPAAVRRLGPDVALVAALVVMTVVSSPRGRFDATQVGDEPKYLRFLENWYQGNGLDISRLENPSDLPPGSPPDLVGDVVRLQAALRFAVSDLTADAAHLFGEGDGSPRAGTGGNWFLPGKRGGMYQVHNPGMSVLLFPGYIVDRYFLNSNPQPGKQLPAHLYATGGSLVIVYLVWGIAVFRLLSVYSGDLLTAWLLAFVAMASIPAGPFAYQYYPESAGGLLVTLLVYQFVRLRLRGLSAASAGRAAASDRSSWLLPIFCGVAAGYLPWLHPRFGPITIAAAAAFSAIWRRERSALVRFWLSLLVLLAALGLYNYSITGDVSPWALYDRMVDGPGFSLARIVRDVHRFWIDSENGLVALSPIYLLILPGIIPFFRRSTAVASLVTVTVVSVAVLSAAHTWNGAGTSPGRLIAAVAPLLMLPVADACARFGAARVFVVTAYLLGIVSVQNAVNYNLQFARDDIRFHGTNISGLTAPFPLFEEAGFGGRSLTMALWVIVTICLIVLPMVLRREGERPARQTSWLTATATVMLIFAAAGTLAAATGRMQPFLRHVTELSDVRDRSLYRFLARDGMSMFSSHRGRIEPSAVFDNPRNAALIVESQSRFIGESSRVFLRALDADDNAGWGVATIDFGDGSHARMALIGRGEAAHRYQASGHYDVGVRVARPGLTELTGTVPVDVPLSTDDLFRSTPVSLRIDSIDITPAFADIELEGATDRSASAFWVWMGRADQPKERGRFLEARPLQPSAGASSNRTILHVELNPSPSRGDFMLIVAGSGAARGSSSSAGRSDGLYLRWPSLSDGRALRITAADAAREMRE